MSKTSTIQTLIWASTLALNTGFAGCGDGPSADAGATVAALSSAGVQPTDATSVSRTALAELIVDADAEAQAQGVAQYAVQVVGGEANVRLLDEAAQEIGTLNFSQQADSHHLRYSDDDRTLDFDYVDDRVDIQVDGEQRGSLLLERGDSPSVDASSLTLADVQPQLALVTSVTNDLQLRQAVTQLGGPTIQESQRCPWWVLVGACLAIETGAGTVLCVSCLASQVLAP